MSISEAISFLYASKPMKRCSASTLKRLESSGLRPWVLRMELSIRSSKISHSATISTLSQPVRMFSMAWVPRPPQPIKPALNFSLPAPRTNSGLMIWKAVEPAAALVKEDDKKDLRETESDCIGDPPDHSFYLQSRSVTLAPNESERLYVQPGGGARVHHSGPLVHGPGNARRRAPQCVRTHMASRGPHGFGGGAWQLLRLRNRG